MTKLLFVDVETTGFDPYLNSITQLAGLLDIDGKIEEAFDIKMRPFTSEMVDPEALKVQGITEDEVWEGKSPDQALEEFVSLMNKHIDRYDKVDKAWFIGYNAKFDYDFVRAWAEKCAYKWIGSYLWWPPLDVAQMVALEYMDVRGGFDNFKLGTVAERLGCVAGGGLHDALVDITLTRDVFSKLREDK